METALDIIEGLDTTIKIGFPIEIDSDDEDIKYCHEEECREIPTEVIKIKLLDMAIFVPLCSKHANSLRNSYWNNIKGINW